VQPWENRLGMGRIAGFEGADIRLESGARRAGRG
jgi:hypothetical protein